VKARYLKMRGTERLTVGEAKALLKLVRESARWWILHSERRAPTAHRAASKIQLALDDWDKRPARPQPAQLRPKDGALWS
jgi:hypothetical protein